MKVNVLSLESANVKQVDMPSQFSEPVRPDLIKRAVKAIEANKRQPYGSDPRAGLRHSAFVSKRRHKFKSTYGIGQSRTPRKVISARGTRFNWIGAVVPQTVGGRRAHPPKVAKIWDKKINKKEKRKAIRSAMAASMIKEIVQKRGHKVPDNYPFIAESNIENVDKTKNAIQTLTKLGLKDDLERSGERKIRAGKGKMRGRRYKRKIGPLIVVSEDCPAMKSFSNIFGVDVETVSNLNAQLLAPGSVPGRLVVFSEKAIEKIGKENLFTDNILAAEKKKEKPKKKATPAKQKKPEIKKEAPKKEVKKEMPKTETVKQEPKPEEPKKPEAKTENKQGIKDSVEIMQK